MHYLLPLWLIELNWEDGWWTLQPIETRMDWINYAILPKGV
jgi:hypothetical protein